MPILLKDVKRDLESDLSSVGRNSDGSYKHTPPNIIGRKLKNYTLLKVSKVNKVTRPETETISFSALVKSESSPSNYLVNIKFFDMKFKELKTTQFKFRAIAKRLDNAVVYHRLPNVSRNPVTMRCRCEDFRHRFEHQLDAKGGLLGGKRSYTRETEVWSAANLQRWEDGKLEKKPRPFANSTDKLGICKHINSVLNHLRDTDEIKER